MKLTTYQSNQTQFAPVIASFHEVLYMSTLNLLAMGYSWSGFSSWSLNTTNILDARYNYHKSNEQQPPTVTFPLLFLFSATQAQAASVEDHKTIELKATRKDEILAQNKALKGKLKQKLKGSAKKFSTMSHCHKY